MKSVLNKQQTISLKLSVLWYSNERRFMNDYANFEKQIHFKSSVHNMKIFLFLVFLAELIYLYFRNLIFKEEENGNLVVTGTDIMTGNSYKYF